MSLMFFKVSKLAKHREIEISSSDLQGAEQSPDLLRFSPSLSSLPPALLHARCTSGWRGVALAALPRHSPCPLLLLAEQETRLMTSAERSLNCWSA